MQNIIAANYINQNIDFLANQISEKVFQNNSQRFSEHQMDISMMQELFKNDLNKLFLSLASERPKIFTSYIRWKRSMLESRLIPIFVLKVNYEIFVDVILKDAEKGIAEILFEYLNYGREVYEHLLELPTSYIDEKTPLGMVSREIIDLLLSDDSSRSIDYVMKNLDNKFSKEDLYTDIIKNVQYEIGLLWQLNKITAVQEHIATSKVINILNRINVPDSGKKDSIKIVSACLTREQHEVGIKMVSDYLEFKGAKTYYSGANTPVMGILNSLRLYEPHILAISLAMPIWLVNLQQLLTLVRSHRPDIKVIVGGYLFNDDENLWKTIGVDGFSKDPV